MEEGAHNSFRIPPPGIEFTLTSPKIGIECLPIVDPPWMPQVETKVEEVTIGQDTHVSFCFTIFLNYCRSATIRLLWNILCGE